jgi:hypothetical protein
MGAIIAAAAIGTAGVVAGSVQNSKTNKANQQAYQDSREDYAARLKLAGEGAKALNEEYDKVIEDRPDLTWEGFVRDKIKAINDPWLRQFYTQAKADDFNKLREFGKVASTDNVANLKKAADELSGGRWQEITDQRNKLVLETNAADRMARSYELAAPVRTGASTVRYDDQGRLIEGQRADKQAFTVAQEVQTAVEQEQKSDLRQLENDRLGAAQSQTEKARDYMGFFDATGYATAAESDRSNLLNSYQKTDEERAFRVYEMFAGAAAGIQPSQPAYQSNSAGNELISSGIGVASTALSNYGNTTKKQQPPVAGAVA